MRERVATPQDHLEAREGKDLLSLSRDLEPQGLHSHYGPLTTPRITVLE